MSLSVLIGLSPTWTAEATLAVNDQRTSPVAPGPSLDEFLLRSPKDYHTEIRAETQRKAFWFQSVESRIWGAVCKTWMMTEWKANRCLLNIGWIRTGIYMRSKLDPGRRWLGSLSKESVARRIYLFPMVTLSELFSMVVLYSWATAECGPSGCWFRVCYHGRCTRNITGHRNAHMHRHVYKHMHRHMSETQRKTWEWCEWVSPLNFSRIRKAKCVEWTVTLWLSGRGP